MADEELDLSALDGNDSELFEEIREITEGETDGLDDLENFLNENKLTEHLSLFRDQQIDFETLMILTEPDLKSLGLPLGPFRKLINALDKKKNEMESDALDEGASKTDKDRDEHELPTLADENSFRVIDESGDDSDTHSVKSEHVGDKKKDLTKIIDEPDVNHPYKYDLINLTIPNDMKTKMDLQEPTTVESKTFEMINDERRLKHAIRALRKEKIIVIEAKHTDAYEKTLSILQISTQNVDYVIDFMKMNQNILLLTDIFANPNIIKVYYDARYQIKVLQKYYYLFTINAYCVRTAIKELKYETSSLYGLINKYVCYFKPTESDCCQRPLRNDVKLNLRKETHYLLHIYYKTRNEALEAGIFDSLLAQSLSYCGPLFVPLPERKPQRYFTDFDKFNEAQKLAADELNNWRESLAKDKNVDTNNIITVKDLKQLCMTLPIKKDELLAVVDTRVVRAYFAKLLAILKTARKKYFNDPKDESKYSLKAIDMPKNRSATKTTPNKGAANKTKPAQSPSPNVKPDLKRKSDGFAHPNQANNKKPRFRPKKNNFATPKRNSFDKGNKTANKQPFRNPVNYRGGFQGANPNANKNFQQNPQNIWAAPQNQNFSNNYGGGFKYY